MKKERVTIIRTAVGSPGTAGSIKKMQEAGARVVGLDSNPLSFGLHFCDKGYVIPKATEPNFLQKFLKICDKEKPQAVLSGPETETLILAKNKKLFDQRGIILLMPNIESVKVCSDKIITYDFFKKENIPTPKIFLKGEKIKFPVILKPHAGSGSNNVFKANNNEEWSFYHKKVKDLITQEFIPGIEYTVDIFCDLGGNPLSIVPRIRIQTESGITLKGKTVYEKEIINYCAQIAKKLKLYGPSCIQCIKNEKGIYFLEINTRFGGGSVLGMEADPSIIANLMKIIRGEEPIKSKGFKKNLTMLRYYSEIYTQKQ